MNRYKLCRVEVETKSSVYPLDENGNEITTASMVEFDNCDDYYYAIYENIGDEQFEEWDEYACYNDDKQKAVEEYQQLIEKKRG